MNATTYTITDTHTNTTTTGDAYDTEDTVRGWYPDASAEVTDMLDTLFASLRAGRPDSDTEAALGLTIEA